MDISATVACQLLRLLRFFEKDLCVRIPERYSSLGFILIIFVVLVLVELFRILFVNILKK